MIAPGNNTASELEPYLRDSVHDFFGADGRLSRAASGDDGKAFSYEPRPQQLDMAEAVAEALGRQTHLAVEAGTGVGKSFAYLVPLIHAAVQENIQVVVSTYTISLQEQLMYKDIPFLQKHLGIPFKAALVKGRGNYLCLRRLARARQTQHETLKGKQIQDLKQVGHWAEQTSEGSLQDMAEQPPHDIWDLVAVEPGNCLWQQCPEFSPCYFMKARRKIQEAQVLIVNHHLLFSDLSLRLQGAGFLPDYKMVVFDEAHQMESVASDHLGLRLSEYALNHWMRRLLTDDGGRGLFSMLKCGEGAQAINRLRDESGQFFLDVESWAQLDGQENQRVVNRPLEITTNTMRRITQINSVLRVLADEQEDEDLRAELQSAHRKGMGINTQLEAFLEQALDDQVYWVQREGRRKQMVLYSAPIEVGPVLASTFFGVIPSVVMASATLAVDTNLNYFKERIGAGDCPSRSVGSPFNYELQMKVMVPSDMPEPNAGEAYIGGLSRAIRQLIQRTGGHAFVLFTSGATMKKVAAELGDFFAQEALTLLVQNEGMPRHAMLERFQEDLSSVLFGLDSFWMGVDVPGKALTSVIITRLPFSVPDQPVIKARMDRIKENGGDPFKDYSIPEAILKFRQGVGRLIRSAEDEGIVAILDSRITGKWYGRFFMQALPECPIETFEVG